MQFKHWGKLLLYIILVTSIQQFWGEAYDGKTNSFLGINLTGPFRFLIRSIVSLVILGITLLFLKWIKEENIIPWYTKLYVLFELLALSIGSIRFMLYDHELIQSVYAASMTLAMSPFCAILAYTSYYLKVRGNHL